MRRLAAVVLLVTGGCGEEPVPAGDTGARDAARAFFDGLAAGDPGRAYAVLAPESRRRVPADRFAELARAYARQLGFPADKVQVRSCEEQGDGATAHVVLIGHGGGHTRRFEDGATLRRVDGRWGVVLAANFGSARHR